jgi:hypothetical protein
MLNFAAQGYGSGQQFANLNSTTSLIYGASLRKAGNNLRTLILPLVQFVHLRSNPIGR